MNFLGIFREIQHSPDREFDDYEILRLAGQRLTEQGHEVVLKKPEEVYSKRDLWMQERPELAFVMCEQERMISMLQSWELAGTPVVNSMQGVLNTYRYRLLPLMRQAGVPFPGSVLVWTDSERRSVDSKPAALWVKRGDVHNTQKGDVSLTHKPVEIHQRLDAFHARGIEQAVLQQHVPGDLIKFYGVAGADGLSWFKWFYHKNQELNNYPFSEESLRRMTGAAAGAVGLEVFGGDAIVTQDGQMFIIDINAWPSFALFRDEASKAIAQYLVWRAAGKVPAPSR
jgi:hypothetical protein